MKHFSLLVLALIGAATAKYLLVDVEEDTGPGKYFKLTTVNAIFKSKVNISQLMRLLCVNRDTV